MKWALIPLTVVIALSGCEQKESKDQAATSTSTENQAQFAISKKQEGEPMNQVTTPTGLQYVEEVVGNGNLAQPGQRVTVHYTGWLTDGTKFDSSVDRGQPFKFNLGAGEVIKGWDEGVSGMKVGGKRKLTIPSDLGYGARGAAGAIPPNATLVFDVELLDVQ